MTRISIDDLEVAAEWLDEYELGKTNAPEAESCRRVAAWLRAEADKRLSGIAVRQLVRERGIPGAEARAAAARVRAKQSR